MGAVNTFELCSYSCDPIQYAPHFHENTELIYVKNGQAQLQLENKSYQLRHGNLALISNTKTHSLTMADDNYQRFYLLFSFDALKKAVGDSETYFLLEQMIKNGQELYTLDNEASGHVEYCLNTILNESSHCDPFSFDMSMACFKQIMIWLYRSSSGRRPSASGALSAEVRAIKEWIENNSEKDVRISDLAESNYISHCYLSHCFKEQVGVSPKSYLLHCRLKRARELLITTDLPVAAIAYRCGFNDVNNFIRSFKNDAGQTPRKFRNSYLESKQD